MDDLIRVLLIPRTSSKVELFVNVPLKEIDFSPSSSSISKIGFFPYSPSITEICGSSFISSDDSSLLLFGAPFQHAEDSTRVGVNDQLTPLFTDLVPIGNYLLVAAEGHVPEATTIDSLRGKFKQSECIHIANHRLLDTLFPIHQTEDIYIKAADIQSLKTKFTYSFLYLIRLPASSSSQHIASAADNAKTLFLSLLGRMEERGLSDKLSRQHENLMSFFTSFTADPKAALAALKAMRKTTVS